MNILERKQNPFKFAFEYTILLVLLGRDPFTADIPMRNIFLVCCEGNESYVYNSTDSAGVVLRTN